MRIYFSDFFGCSPDDLEKYGALDISLITDLPLFIDPFLLFNSKKPEYQKLHQEMLEYISFLRKKSESKSVSPALIKSWYHFPEVKQNWLGYSLAGNGGRGLGSRFAQALDKNLSTVLKDFGGEKVTHGTHIEKLCLIKSGVGRDNISDFTTNLIKNFLLEYTQEFAKQFIDPLLAKKFSVPKVKFNYTTESWETRSFILPHIHNDYVILTPEDILTKDDTWISQRDLLRRYDYIAASIPNDALRAQLNNYFSRVLPVKNNGEEHTIEERHKAIEKVLEKFPELIDYYIKNREDNGGAAVKDSLQKVEATKGLFVEQVRQFVEELEKTEFFQHKEDSYSAAMKRVGFLKHVIENNDGYRFFYFKGQPIQREKDLQLIYRLTWFATNFEVDSEVNNGRGPVDYKVSKGSSDKTVIEFKLASNSSLEKNLKNQVEIYKKANNTQKSIKVIIYFSVSEKNKVVNVLKNLGQENDKSIVLIDARKDNKQSASKVTNAHA